MNMKKYVKRLSTRKPVNPIWMIATMKKIFKLIEKYKNSKTISGRKPVIPIRMTAAMKKKKNYRLTILKHLSLSNALSV